MNQNDIELRDKRNEEMEIDLIDLLYQTGLGAKNSEGFGMFVPASAQGPVLGDGTRRG